MDRVKYTKLSRRLLGMMYTSLGLFIAMVLFGAFEYTLISLSIMEGRFYNPVYWILMCASVLGHLVFVVTFVWYLLWVSHTN
jgi:hypothetical protein